MHRLTDDEGNALQVLALALRPDWARNRPGRVFWEANEAGGIVPATDFAHCVRALLVYCGKGAGMRTPNLWAEEGHWWRDTANAELALAESQRRAATGTQRAMQALDIARRLEQQEIGS